MATDVPCAECGEKTTVYPSELEEYDRHFCSRDCQSTWQSANKAGDSHPQYERVTIVCERCGEGFEVPPSRGDSATYCSESCKDGPRMEGVCEQCGSEFSYPPSREDRNKRFCSNACRAEWQSFAFAGEDAPRWRGGKVRYYGSNWQRQRRAALERDGHVCQACGVDEKLHVHHIKPARTFEPVEDANTLKNLVTLCQACHYEWEGIPVRPTLIGESDGSSA